MNFNINQIVSADELSIDINLIKKKLAVCQEIIVFKDNQPQFIISSLNSSSDTGENKINRAVNKKMEMENKAEKGVKIGKLVQETMRKLCYNNILTIEELEKLSSEKYSCDTFNLNFPVLKLYNPTLSFDEQKRDSKGYNRYYSFSLTVNGRQYLLCSQWIENLHRQKYEEWLEKWL